ncbi:MAG: sulfate adenylyltransferase [Planctomycetota bacterium]|nr:MAG: sulfate adenylyltransferase [Planctomycetota bacterium]
MSDKGLIPPHGGALVDLVVSPQRRAELEAKLPGMIRVKLPEREQCDLELLAVGAMSPLKTFMNDADFHGVCENMRLASGQVWSMPITCSVDKATADRIDLNSQVVLTDDRDRELAVMTVEEKYHHDKKLEAEKAYGTTDDKHPGVAVVNAQGDVCLSGPLEVLTPRHEPAFGAYRRTPAQTRAIFDERGWRTVVAFQTRNPIHRAHEYITKCALEICDGLMVHPLVGETKEGDIPADVRMQCYQVLLDNYYNPQNTLLSVWPAAMRYAGPREAILHALVRKNYGCTHFIVGRDHAGVGDYYGTYDAQRIFDEFEPAEIGITPLRFEHSFWCKKSGAMASDKTTNSGKEDRVFLSGTKVREMLANGQRPPVEFTRPEIADILIAAMRGK